MRTFIVGYDSNTMPQWAFLPISFQAEVAGEISRIVTTTSMVSHCVPNAEGCMELTSNFDLALIGRPAHRLAHLIDHPNAHAIPRPPKDTMRVEIDAAGMDIAGYRPVRSWCRHPHTDTVASNYVWGPRGKGTYVIKSALGARGIGQILVPAEVPGDQVLISIDCISANENTKAVLESKHPGIAYNIDGEHRVGEGLQRLKEALFIQEYIEGIDAEYRVLVGANGRLVWCPRSFYGEIYKQATGVTDKYDDVIASGQYVPDLELQKKVQQFTANLG